MIVSLAPPTLPPNPSEAWRDVLNYSSATLLNMTLLFFFGASSTPSSGLLVSLPALLWPDSEPETDILGKVNPSFSSPGVGNTGSIELVVLLLLPPGWNKGVEED